MRKLEAIIQDYKDHIEGLARLETEQKEASEKAQYEANVQKLDAALQSLSPEFREALRIDYLKNDNYGIATACAVFVFNGIRYELSAELLKSGISDEYYHEWTICRYWDETNAFIKRYMREDLQDSTLLELLANQPVKPVKQEKPGDRLDWYRRLNAFPDESECGMSKFEYMVIQILQTRLYDPADHDYDYAINQAILIATKLCERLCERLY